MIIDPGCGLLSSAAFFFNSPCFKFICDSRVKNSARSVGIPLSYKLSSVYLRMRLYTNTTRPLNFRDKFGYIRLSARYYHNCVSEVTSRCFSVKHLFSWSSLDPYVSTINDVVINYFFRSWYQPIKLFFLLQGSLMAARDYYLPVTVNQS